MDSNGGNLGICKDCLNDMPWHDSSQCPQCALPTFGNQLCGHCLASPPEFDATRALFRYEYPFDRMLQRYKYGENLPFASLFAGLMASSIDASPDLIIPMPLHPQRLKERGFNQSLEIAKLIAKPRNIAMHKDACQRIKFAPPQASLPLKERVKNMKGAFTCGANLQGLNVALIDDVMTTGASLNALAKAVKQAGAAHVECWVIARTLPR